MTKHAFLFVLASLASHALAGRKPDASQWKPPTPTEALDPHDRAHLQISPRPTDSPLFRNAGELRRRDSSSTSIGSNTCGFWTDDGKHSTPPPIRITIPVTNKPVAQAPPCPATPRTPARTKANIEDAAWGQSAPPRPSRLYATEPRRNNARTLVLRHCAVHTTSTTRTA